eukprot:9105194-Pyramimonas_sp.AAC.2
MLLVPKVAATGSAGGVPSTPTRGTPEGGAAAQATGQTIPSTPQSQKSNADGRNELERNPKAPDMVGSSLRNLATVWNLHPPLPPWPHVDR